VPGLRWYLNATLPALWALGLLSQTPVSEGPFSRSDASQLAGYPAAAGEFFGWADRELGVLDEEWDQLVGRSTPASDRRNCRMRVEYEEHLDVLPRISHQILLPARWSRVVAGAWARPDAILSKEGGSALLGLGRAARRPECWDHLVPSLGDNLSEILCAERGRVKNHELNSLCRRAAAYQLAAGIGWRRRHVRTHVNIANSGSRLADGRLSALGETLGAGQIRQRLTPRGIRDAAPYH
jgi:hypothetical protein